MKRQFISSKQNPRYRAALKLKTSRGRKQQQRFIIFGEREVLRAAESPNIKIVELYMNADSQQPADESAETIPKSIEADVFELPNQLFSELQYGERTEAIVAVAERPDLGIANLVVPSNPLVIILQGIEKPGNIGAVLRSMDAVAADALILCEPQCDVLHPNSIRSSMGGVFTIPTAIATSSEAAAWCQQNDLAIYAASDSGKNIYTDVEMTGGIAMVFGNEAMGLSDFWLNQQTGTPNCKIQLIAIPMRGISDSLNISVAAAVMLFEARRQRDARG